MNRSEKYKIVIQWEKKKEGFVAMAPELGNCIVRASTQIEVLRLVNEAIERQIAGLEANGLVVPSPVSESRFSGKILLRIDPLLHTEIAERASLEEISITHLIERSLKGK